MPLLQRFTYLNVVVGVPVRVIDDDGICRSQIDAEASSSCREEESKLRSTRGCSDEKRKKNRVDIDDDSTKQAEQDVQAKKVSPLKRSIASCLMLPVTPPSILSYL